MASSIGQVVLSIEVTTGLNVLLDAQMPLNTACHNSPRATLLLSHAVLAPKVSILLQFRVAALINDSVGTLAGGCYVDADTKIGVILGTGTNACYVEEASNISALAGKNNHGQQRPLMAINTEWGNFDASSLPSTDVSSPRDPCSV